MNDTFGFAKSIHVNVTDSFFFFRYFYFYFLGIMFILVSAITINHEIEHQLTSNYSVFLIFHNKSVCQNLQEYS